MTTAVLVIDVQVGLIEGERPVYEGAAVVARIADVIERARAADVAVIFVQDDDVGTVGGSAWQIHPSVAPLPVEMRVQKRYGDAFFQTLLHEILQSQGIKRVLIMGCKTDVCIDVTSRRAVSLGYDVILVSDAHTTTDNRFLSAPHSIEYYNLILDGFGLEDGFGNGVHSIELQQAGAIMFPVPARAAGYVTPSSAV